LKRLLITTAAIGALAAIVAVAPAGAGAETIYAPKDCTKPKVEPKSILLACGDAGIVLKHLRWSDWNGPKAKGKGKLWVKDCDPNCAEGDFDKFKAKVTLLKAKSTTCGGRTVQMYRRAHVRFPGEKPDGARNLRSFQLACNS
jgi:hypothetical protein